MPQIPLSPLKPEMGDRQEVRITHPLTATKMETMGKAVEGMSKTGKVIGRMRRKKQGGRLDKGTEDEGVAPRQRRG